MDAINDWNTEQIAQALAVIHPDLREWIGLVFSIDPEAGINEFVTIYRSIGF